MGRLRLLPSLAGQGRPASRLDDQTGPGQQSSARPAQVPDARVSRASGGFLATGALRGLAAEPPVPGRLLHEDPACAAFQRSYLHAFLHRVARAVPRPSTLRTGPSPAGGAEDRPWHGEEAPA